MVIFMPYYRQHYSNCHSRTRPTTSNPQNDTRTTNEMSANGCKFASGILCRFTLSLFLFVIAFFLFQLSISNSSNQIEGSYIIASILLIISMVSFIRTCHHLRRYHIMLDSRNRLIQRLRERQQAYDLALSSNNNENPDLVRNVNTDLPSYKELFPSHRAINNSRNDSSSLLPPSYDDYIKTLDNNHPITTHPITSLRSTTLSLNTDSQSQNNPTQCFWITDHTRTPISIRGTVTYV
ncbi:unnamed protein product [Rotaria socialis]|uniref:Uncharacterized protein n=1 Tax=Rotaria socialis TaxID=392032 RepID=A0A817W4I5_9BILA|nr:unnamed protein product [Rotaria socialis]CAF4679190.1 unnamed protein product [Rotaria socialis]